jgi:hypothetical protein
MTHRPSRDQISRVAFLVKNIRGSSEMALEVAPIKVCFEVFSLSVLRLSLEHMLVRFVYC